MGKFFLTLFASITVSIAYAGIPQTINYQGYLTDASGSPIDGLVPITFSLYALPTGGSPVWSETQSTVSVDQGLFSVQLGNVSQLTQNLFNSALFIGIEVDGDAEMVPRRPLSLQAYAFQANDAFTVGGQSAFALDQSAHVADNDNPHNVTTTQLGAALSTDLTALMTQVNDLVSQVSTLQTDLANADATISSLQTDVNQLQTGLSGETTARINTDTGLQNSIDAISANSVLALDSMLTLSGDTAQFSGVNVQIVSGGGATDAAPNGTGNLIVGYNEVDTDTPICSLGQFDDQTSCTGGGGVWLASHKSGSHNVVIGKRHNYSSYGGLLAGFNSNITGPFASVSGGEKNSARSFGGSVSGGVDNVVKTANASVSGGSQNTASGNASSVAGGSQNTATGSRASVGGGFGIIAGASNGFEAANTSALTAIQDNSVLDLDNVLTLSNSTAQFSGVNVQIVSGAGSTDATPNGTGNLIVGYDAPGGRCTGGFDLFHTNEVDCLNDGGSWMPGDKTGSHNLIVGDGHTYSSFGGLVAGRNNRIMGAYASVSGGQTNTAFADQSSISAGQGNVAGDPAFLDNTVGKYSGVSGGRSNTASGSDSSVNGGSSNTASGSFSTVSGGQQNTASGADSSVNGGFINTASGLFSSVSGGTNNTAIGLSSSVIGGNSNTASGGSSSVSGGNSNTATGFDSSVGGGDNLACTTDFCAEGSLSASD